MDKYSNDYLHPNIVTWKGVGEVPASEIPYIPVHIDNPYRHAFEAGFCESKILDGFKGKILLFDRRGILFERVLFTTGAYWDLYDEYHEDHVWIRGARLPKEINKGDCISFDAQIYLYRRKDGTLDYGLKNFEFIEKLDGYAVPTDEELEKQHQEHFIRQLQCETCLWYEKCDLMNCLIK